jgi:hypothetical protein
MAENFATLLEVFEREFRSRAELCGWLPVPNDQLLRNDGSRGVESLLNALQSVPSEAHSSQRLPEFRQAFDLRPTSLSVLLCRLDAKDPGDSYRAALWWTGLIRSEIAPLRRTDLHLFLIGPIGTSIDPAWKGRRSRIESDERFCRKFVWLPSSNPDSSEIQAFLDRTFLAKPWEGQSVEPRSLDPLERLAQDASHDSPLTPDEVRRWMTRLGVLDTTGMQQIAEDLVGILEGKR